MLPDTPKCRLTGRPVLNGAEHSGAVLSHTVRAVSLASLGSSQGAGRRSPAPFAAGQDHCLKRDVWSGHWHELLGGRLPRRKERGSGTSYRAAEPPASGPFLCPKLPPVAPIRCLRVTRVTEARKVPWTPCRTAVRLLLRPDEARAVAFSSAVLEGSPASPRAAKTQEQQELLLSLQAVPAPHWPPLPRQTDGGRAGGRPTTLGDAGEPCKEPGPGPPHGRAGGLGRPDGRPGRGKG